MSTELIMKHAVRASWTSCSHFSLFPVSNQSAAEKMSLEDEIKRCKVLFTSKTKRSHTAQVGLNSGPQSDTFTLVG